MALPQDWPRTKAGTLKCPCGKPGILFPQVDIYLDDELEWKGALGGYCSDECMALGSARGHPVPDESYVATDNHVFNPSPSDSSGRGRRTLEHTNMPTVEQPGLF